MKLPNKYSYGQLFAFSGLDGKNSQKNDFVGMYTDSPINIRFEFPSWVKLSLPLENMTFSALTSDIIDGVAYGKKVLVTLSDCFTAIGLSPVKPEVLTEKPSKREQNGETEEILTREGYRFALSVRESADGFLFAFRYMCGSALPAVPSYGEIERIIGRNYGYFEKIPAPKEKDFEQLYYKCIAVNKLNVYSPDGKIKTRWTTPDRVPHKYMWLWDSVFHAMAFAEYDIETAKAAIVAPLSLQREDGFIAHMADCDGFRSDVLQPPVAAWGAWNIYEKCGDREFLRFCAEREEKFLLWCMKNRDCNNNGLLEWASDSSNTHCKCDESGMDNSPRFDFDEEVDAVDFSSYLCNDLKYLSYCFDALGDKSKAEKYGKKAREVGDRINELLYCESDGMYYDRLLSGKLTMVQSSAGFLPLFAGICSKERAGKLVKILTDEKKFWTEMPVPSISFDSPYYDADMWRGCSWLNINYFIIRGLENYGYSDVAAALREKTLRAVKERYDDTGNIFEFYDACDKISPFDLKRKGTPPEKPDYRVHIHSITDYNWSACFTELLIQGIN